MKAMGVQLIEWLDSRHGVHQPTVVCLGYFDGVHLGHQEIVRRAGKHTLDGQRLLCVHTYDRAPGSIIRPGAETAELTPLDEKAALLKHFGAQLVAVSRFDDAMMHMSGGDFVYQVLISKLAAEHIVAGYDHRFGYHADTDADKLKAICRRYGLGLTIVPQVTIADGRAISSTAIRQALTAGDIALAEEMLGRPCSQAMLRMAGKKKRVSC
jgi:riboflavin kinase/FMN adenylyltransferase